MRKTCEREGCGHEARTYHTFGRTVSTHPFMSSSGGPHPDQPITLCHDHAIEAFGIAFVLPAEA